MEGIIIQKRDIPNTGSEIIMNETMIFALLLSHLLHYLEVMLEVLFNYQCTVKLNKTRLLGPSQKLVGIDVKENSNTSVEVKRPVFFNIGETKIYY